jgi:hypothetical protein
MVLTHFGQDHSENDIRRLLGNPLFGITLAQAAHRLLAIGAVAQWHADWGLDDLRDCLRDGGYPIVGIERRFFGHPSATHAIVMTAVQSLAVELLDPLLGPTPHISQLATFAAAWRSAGQEALVLLSPLPA